MKLRAAVLALLAAAAFVICALRPAQAAPALWVVQSSAGKIYLFGTVHLLREGTQWSSPELEAAISESQDLYLEIADPANTSNALTSVAKIGFDRDHPLSTKISKADVGLLDTWAKRNGFGSEVAFEPMNPWLVFLILSVTPALHSGYATTGGVDLQIRKEFVAAGKPVRGFETIDMQAHLFADEPQSTQVALLDAELKNPTQETGASELDAIVNAWLAGNQSALATTLQFDELTRSPIYARLLTDRNKAWASALSERLKQPGTSFVAVGAAHLLGPQGVPALLQAMGYTVTRVQIAQTASPPAPAPAPSASPAPAASPPLTPATMTPPAGWTTHGVSLSVGAFKADKMWVDPQTGGVIVSGHLDLPGIAGADLDSLDALFHHGLVVVAGAKGAPPSTRVKVCNGKQDATYSKVTLPTVKEDIVLAVSDRAYVGEYVRRKDVADDAAAVRSLLTLCAP
jgi:uncharacterized protein